MILSVSIYPYLSILIYLSLSIYPYLSILICPYLSLSIFIYLYLSLSISIYLYLFFPNSVSSWGLQPRIAPVCPGAGAGSGSTGFRRRFQEALVQSQVQRVREKVAEAKPGQVHLTHGNPAEVFPALGFAACFVAAVGDTAEAYFIYLYLSLSMFIYLYVYLPIFIYLSLSFSIFLYLSI